MTDRDDEERAAGAEAADGGQLAPTPFDSPFAAPLIFFALAVWLAYDGWGNRSPGPHPWQWLIRGGAAALLVLAVHFLVCGLREWRAGG